MIIEWEDKVRKLKQSLEEATKNKYASKQNTILWEAREQEAQELLSQGRENINKLLIELTLAIGEQGSK